MKKRILLVTLILLSFTLGVFYSCNKKDEIRTVKIGSILTLTGDNAMYTPELKKGMELAKKLVNDDSSSKHLKLDIIYEDDKGNGKDGISAYNKLKSIDNVNYIIGAILSEVTLALAPLAEKDNLVLMSPTSSDVRLSTFGDHVYRIFPSDTYDGIFLAGFISNDLNFKKAAIVSLEANSTIEVSKVFESKFKELGGEITASLNYKKGERNFRNIIQKLKQNAAEVVFIPGYLDEIAVFLKQAKELNLNKKFVGISTLYDSKFINLTGALSEGVFLSAPIFDPNNTNPSNKKFVEEFKKMYQAEPSILAGYGYDVVNISYKAISESPDNNINNYIANLNKIKDYPGVTGNTTFDKNGDVLKQLKIFLIKDGKFTDYNNGTK